MSLNADPHLNYDELMRNMVDSDDLDAGRRAHLAACEHCRGQAEKLARRYHRLGAMARELAPEPGRAFRLPAGDTTGRRWQLKTAVATALAGALILAFTLAGPGFFTGSEETSKTAANSMEEDDRLLARIDDLVHDALPSEYQNLAAVSDPVLTEDLIDWIVPSIEEENMDLEPKA